MGPPVMNGDAADNQPVPLPRPARRPDIDWVRALAVLLLVPFHASLIFQAPGAYHITSGDRTPFLGYAAGFVSQWHMPLLFALAGMATWFALQFRSPGQYAKERLKRLLVPLVFGTLVIVPPQMYYQRLSEGRFQGSYLSFYPHFFDGVYPQGNLTYNHLWFILYLVVFSMLSLPVLVWLNGQAGRRFTAKLAAFCERRGAIFLFAVPVAVTESLFRARWGGLQTLISDWANFTQYLYLFILGFVICSEERFWRAIERHGLAALVCGVATTTIGIAWYASDTDPRPDYSPAWTLLMVLRAFNAWFWMIALLSAGKRYLSFSNGLLPYVREGSYPFYVLHQTVLIGIGYYVMSWQIGVMPRFLTVVIATTIATTAIYDVLVRRTNATRFLFGMKPRKA